MYFKYIEIQCNLPKLYTHFYMISEYIYIYNYSDCRFLTLIY